MLAGFVLGVLVVWLAFRVNQLSTKLKRLTEDMDATIGREMRKRHEAERQLEKQRLINNALRNETAEAAWKLRIFFKQMNASKSL